MFILARSQVFPIREENSSIGLLQCEGREFQPSTENLRHFLLKPPSSHYSPLPQSVVFDKESPKDSSGQERTVVYDVQIVLLLCVYISLNSHQIVVNGPRRKR